MSTAEQLREAEQARNQVLQEHAFRPRVVQDPPRPVDPVKEAEERVVALRTALRLEMAAHVRERREAAAREYCHRAQALLAAFYDLAALDVLIQRMGGQPSLNPAFFHSLVKTPHPGPTLAPGFVADHAYGIPFLPGGSGDTAAQDLPIQRRATQLEAEVRAAFAGSWPFTN